MEQNWSRVKSNIQSLWSGIDDDDLKKTRGNLNKLITLIHEKTGEEKAQIFDKVTAIL